VCYASYCLAQWLGYAHYWIFFLRQVIKYQIVLGIEIRSNVADILCVQLVSWVYYLIFTTDLPVRSEFCSCDLTGSQLIFQSLFLMVRAYGCWMRQPRVNLWWTIIACFLCRKYGDPSPFIWNQILMQPSTTRWEFLPQRLQ